MERYLHDLLPCTGRQWQKVEKGQKSLYIFSGCFYLLTLEGARASTGLSLLCVDVVE